MMAPDRWKAEVTYRTERGPNLLVTYDFEDLSDLEDLVERGPDWNSIVKIEVTLARVSTPGQTIESAERS